MKQFYQSHFLATFKEKPKRYIGIELEFPIVAKDARPTSHQVSIGLLNHFTEVFDFSIHKKDGNEQTIEIVSQNGDMILFEVSYNILEIAFSKAETIFELEKRFDRYLEEIQSFLQKHDHYLEGVGIHPNWQVNDNRPVATKRYQMLMAYLQLGLNKPNLHSFVDYAAYICSSQVQLDVSKDELLRTLNAFNKIEPVKAHLFPNSFFSPLPDQSIGRDFLWEHSMHGLLKENVGIYPQNFSSIEELLSYKGKAALFYTVRDNVYYYFEPIPLKDYMNKKEITAFTLEGDTVLLTPQRSDLEFFRSYHYQELTKRGTIEFRSVCTQALERTFAPAAFHLGLLENLVQLEEILSSSQFFVQFGQNYPELRHRFSHLGLSSKEKEEIESLSQKILACAKKGLELRGLGEERYLPSII